MNKAFINKIVKLEKLYNTGVHVNNGGKLTSNNFRRLENQKEEMLDEFGEYCNELAQKLYLRTINPYKYTTGFYDFVKEYMPKYPFNQALEKFVLDKIYGKGVMNNKFRLKYNGTPSNKLNRLVKLSAYINNPANWRGGKFNWKNVNDPDYYDLFTAEGYGNFNWYPESLGGRIRNYRRKVNALKKKKT